MNYPYSLSDMSQVMIITGTFHFDDYSHWTQFFSPETSKTRHIVTIVTKMFGFFAKTGQVMVLIQLLRGIELLEKKS